MGSGERTSFETDRALRAFSRQARTEQRAYDDRRLTSYRYPRERLALVVALAVVAGVVVAVSHWSWAAGVGLVGLLALTALVTRLAAAQQAAQGAEVTPTQFADIYPMLSELRERFALPRTRVFVTQSPIVNASSFGLREPYVVVLNSALVEALDPIELKSVLGHELGHVKFGHTRVGVVLGGLDTSGLLLPFPFNLIASARDAVFRWWQRSTELSADRAGIIACGRVSKAISAQLKVGVGPSLLQHVNLADLAQQAADMRGGVSGLEHFLSQMGASHPFLIDRVAAMLDFVGEPEEAPASELAVPARTPLRRARLRPRGQASVQGEQCLTPGRPLVVGRSPSTDLQLRDRAVSRRHFEVAWRDDGYVLEDLDSNNGTFVNGQRVRSVALHDADVIRVGMTELEFTFSDEL
ncbi:MAG: FHA domain-containing protein [Chloroflexi bacterium]|nr:FHA domain-containing protein [Chloroflexota bacterium]